MTFEAMLFFFTVCLSLCLIPCPEMVVVGMQSSMYGRLAGIAIVLGMCTGLVLQVVAMAFGITAIVQTSEAVFTGMKIVGTLYLFYLAWQAFRHPLSLGSKQTVRSENRPPLLALYWRGIMINLTNPMNPLFLLVFLPPFVDQARGPVLGQLLLLGGLLVLAVLIMFSTYSVLSDIAGNRLLQSSKVQRCLQYGSGITIAGFAIFLAMAGPTIA